MSYEWVMSKVLEMAGAAVLFKALRAEDRSSKRSCVEAGEKGHGLGFSVITPWVQLQFSLHTF